MFIFCILLIVVEVFPLNFAKFCYMMLLQSVAYAIVILSFCHFVLSVNIYYCVHCQEIHAVRVADLSFVTGGTCSSKDILDHERVMLNVSCLQFIV